MPHNQTQSEQWFPIHNKQSLSSPNVYWGVALPNYAPDERIHVNAQRLGRLANIGGFGALRISSYSGDVTETKINIGPVARDGTTTYTGAVSITEAETARTLLDEANGSGAYDEYVPRRGEIPLNMSEINRRVGLRDETFRDPEVWSSELNKALAAGFRKATDESLLKKPPRETVIHYLAVIGISTSLGILANIGIKNANPADILLWNTIGYHLISRPFFTAWPLGLSPKERRWSLFPVYQLDRVFAAQALTRTLNLVKSGEPKQVRP